MKRAGWAAGCFMRRCWAPWPERSCHRHLGMAGKRARARRYGRADAAGTARPLQVPARRRRCARHQAQTWRGAAVDGQLHKPALDRAHRAVPPGLTRDGPRRCSRAVVPAAPAAGGHDAVRDDSVAVSRGQERRPAGQSPSRAVAVPDLPHLPDSGIGWDVFTRAGRTKPTGSGGDLGAVQPADSFCGPTAGRG